MPHGRRENGHRLRILEAVEEVNDAQKEVLVQQDRRSACGDDLRGRTFAVWGLAFKPNTDDMREAPSRAPDRRAARARRDACARTIRWRMDEARRVFALDLADRPDEHAAPLVRAARRRTRCPAPTRS